MKGDEDQEGQKGEVPERGTIWKMDLLKRGGLGEMDSLWTKRKLGVIYSDVG